MSATTARAAEVLKRRSPDPRVNLSSNELTHPLVEPLLARALAGVGPEMVRRYPRTAEPLARVAGLLGVGFAEFMLTPGSDTAIRTICRRFRERGGRRLILQDPNYDAWRQEARRGLELTAVGAEAGDAQRQGELLLEAANRCDGALIGVSLPNGPGGWSLPGEVVDALAHTAARRGHQLVLDSCYQAFDGPLTAQLARGGGPVVVVQTFSKSHGLAGLRAAVVCADPELVADLAVEWIEQTVSAAAVAVVEYVLGCEAEFGQVWADIVRAREDAADRMRSFGLRPLPSGGNFLTVDASSAAWATQLAQGMSAAGYRIRDLRGVPGLDGCLRFTIADEATTRRAVDALAAVVARTPPSSA
jgi:histidinol-phosphate aminotransferase